MGLALTGIGSADAWCWECGKLPFDLSGSYQVRFVGSKYPYLIFALHLDMIHEVYADESVKAESKADGGAG